MSIGEWIPIPPGLLKMKLTPRAFGRLSYEVQVVVSQLAKEQEYKCALCSQDHSLEIEHDHDPEYGTGDVLTIYNIRGLVCRSCNWHIMIYERNRDGDYVDFGEASSRFDDRDWDNYNYPYQCRVNALNDERLMQEMGFRNFWRRKELLQKFDEWHESGGAYPWYWGFDEIKDQKYGKIRTPKQFFAVLAAILEYVKGEIAKNPEWRPPEAVMPALIRIKEFLDEIRPIVEPRYKELLRQRSVAEDAAVIAN